MENRLPPFDYHELPEEVPITVEVNQNERLMRITLEMPDDLGLLDEEDEFPEELEGEIYLEEKFIVREREFETFVKVLHYNRMRYRVETIR